MAGTQDTRGNGSSPDSDLWLDSGKKKQKN